MFMKWVIMTVFMKRVKKKKIETPFRFLLFIYKRITEFVTFAANSLAATLNNFHPNCSQL
jgi:hypothetical protein